MARARKPWVRGAVVIGLAGAMMAAALMSPALAVRLATTSYVKAKVNQAINSFRGEAATTFIEDGLQYARTPSTSIVPGGFAIMSLACPAGTHVTGGGAAVPNLLTDNSELEASYPSNGASTTAGTTGWTASIQNDGGAAFNASTYAICAKSSGASAYGEGVPPAKYTTTVGRH